MRHAPPARRDPPSDRASLRDALTAHLHALAAPGPRGNRTLVARAEDEVRADPGACIRFDEAGHASLSAAGRTFRAGLFETPRLGDLRRRAAEARRRAGDPGATLRFFVLDGASPATDIGALQATAPPGSLFQVASQFNCLEAPGACVVDVADYLHDPTQGPRASVSAFPGCWCVTTRRPGRAARASCSAPTGRRSTCSRSSAPRAARSWRAAT